MKKVKIKSVDDFLSSKFKVKVKEIYPVVHEAQGESKYGYLINTKNESSIVMYAHEVDVIENKKNEKNKG